MNPNLNYAIQLAEDRREIVYLGTKTYAEILVEEIKRLRNQLSIVNMELEGC